MKNLIAAILFLGSANAFAMPAVGDSALYNITVTNGGTTIQFTQKIELTAYDKTAKEYTMTITLANAAGQSKVVTQAVKEDDLATDDYLSQLLSFCDQSAIGGVTKKVTVNLAATATKPAATVSLDACELPTQGENKGITDIGAVPFGTLHSDYTDAKGVHVVIDLIGAKAGPTAAASQAAN